MTCELFAMERSMKWHELPSCCEWNTRLENQRCLPTCENSSAINNLMDIIKFTGLFNQNMLSKPTERNQWFSKPRLKNKWKTPCWFYKRLTSRKRSSGDARAPVNVLVKKIFQSSNVLLIPKNKPSLRTFVSDLIPSCWYNELCWSTHQIDSPKLD